jgi:hypothetical protein
MNTVITANCPQCGSADTRKLASVYGAGMNGVMTEKGETFSGTATSAGAVATYPPQKMANWTGFTLSILLWTPIIWLFLFLSVQHLNGDPTRQETMAQSAAFVTAVLVALAAWSVPAWLQRRKARRYNGEVWAPAMKRWHDSTVCLNCCKVYA